MTAKECITGRRSIRQYTDQPVSHELLAQIVAVSYTHLTLPTTSRV